MILEDPILMEEFRNRPCDLCGHAAPNDVHHLMSRGAGRVDVRSNLSSLCREDHTRVGQDPVYKGRLWKIRTEAEGRSPAEEVWRIRNLRKGSDYAASTPSASAGQGEAGADGHGADQAGAGDHQLPADVPGRGPQRGYSANVEIAEGGWKNF